LAGMPRRIPDYPDAYAAWNAMCSFGSYVSVMGIFCFFLVVHLTFGRGNRIDRSYGEHTTIEWVVNTPPAYHTFQEPPVIRESAGPTHPPARAAHEPVGLACARSPRHPVSLPLWPFDPSL
uniref:Cytochrome c oxidase subunit 1 n=1 Tax=Selaginella nipponica TaxID=872861 RepID=A0A7U3TX12_9TRAC|nr:cytochrome c oxidase subunit 1 [Selaginella nipponica]